MTSPTRRVSLTRASADDTTAIATLIFHSFDSFARENFFGVPFPSQIPFVANEFAKHMSTDPADIWIKVTDDSTGEIVAASNWKIYLAPESALQRARDTPKPWIGQAEVRERMKLLMEPMNEARAKANPGPFMYLHILATHPDHRRRGLGSMMMQWGVDVADSLCLPGWIEASPEGNFLYKRFGFFDFEEIRRDDELLGRKGEVLGMSMKRDARPAPTAFAKHNVAEMDSQGN